MKRPDPLHLPKDLNPHAIHLWNQACDHLPDSLDAAWKQAIGEFVGLCHRDGFVPFVKVSRNVAIRSFLYRERRKIVQFLDFTELMASLRSVRIKRRITITDYGFEIHVYTQIPIQNRAFLKNLFTAKTRFKLMRDRERRYYTDLTPWVKFYFFEHYHNLYDVGYIIKCPMHPDYAGGYDKADFVLNQIWKPLYHQFRSRKDASPIMHL